MKRGTLHRKVSGLETIYKVRDTRIEYKDEFKKGHLKEEWDTGERRERGETLTITQEREGDTGS